MKNLWKKLFFTLFGINLAILLFLLIMIFLPPDTNHVEKGKQTNENLVTFPVETNKEDLNKIINYYIAKNDSKGAIDYKVYLKDDVELYGAITFFGENLQLKLTFVPEALDNGDLLLKQKEISIGQLNLPVSYVMKFVAEQYQFPNWVSIQPKEEQVYVALNKMKLNSDLHIQVNKFDLKKDKINLTFGIPTN
ncbi:YpmS family protein [Cytobacillus sp. Hz8]|uniref:YpmS family protein n=1 Tax=Cytobacillus sp. Hz8 TaxID=3347168 RepID=UPI0035DCA14C